MRAAEWVPAFAGTYFLILLRGHSDAAVMKPRRLLRGLRHVLQVGRVFEMHRCVRLERISEPELLADLAHRRHDLLAQQADTGPRILVADRAVIAPDAVDAGTGLFEDPAQFRDDRLRRAEKDPPIGDLLLEGRPAARVLGPPDRELHKVAAQRRRKIARRVRPYRMREAGELTLHPQELPSVLLRLFLAIRDMHLLEITAVLRTGLVAGLERDL